MINIVVLNIFLIWHDTLQANGNVILSLTLPGNILFGLSLDPGFWG
jgi:hypothetical protein